MIQEISCHMLKITDIRFPLRIPVSHRRAVDAPRLASGPCGAIPVSLAGRPMIRLSRLHIHEKGVPRRVILPNDIGDRRMDMLLRDIPVFCVPGLLRRPIEQRQIQQTVDDKPVILRLIHRPPRLDKFPGRMVSGDQLVRRHNSRPFSLPASGQLISGDAGRAVEKAHIVMIYVRLRLDSLIKAVDLNLSCFLQSLVAAPFIGQPYLAGPEARRPVDIGCRPVEALLAVRLFEGMRKFL